MRRLSMTKKTADWTIALVSAAWGSSYLLMKMGLGGMEPFTLIAWRFLLAFGLTAPLFWGRLRLSDLKTIGRSAVLGFVMFVMLGLLITGLETTTASSAGFLTSAMVVFVPMLQIAITRRKPTFAMTSGILLTMGGIALLTLRGSLTFEGGSALCLLGAFVYAVHIILTNRFTRQSDGLSLGVLQIGFIGLFGLLFGFAFETPTLPQGTSEWTSVIGLAVICSAFGYIAQTVAQKYTTPERIGVLFSLEPVFAALFGFVFLGEMLGLQGYLGALLILGGVLVSGMKKAPLRSLPRPPGIPGRSRRSASRVRAKETELGSGTGA
ncbi:DMT family transporter [Saccharibacillus sp. CPCC 101409]|uniref:DMT family transporter n=1 Tax=Saccharibacillus sp. CPCC 101409 TaxID=3058041 RepID=UPI002671A95A|nr:DMT family transporter [Saccharibacillus sp. CPCC 101409]MDO3412312.1 DMT family transporter [Saccharibacillus sp. CPCC 101409]